ncbi:DUF559 domain-containing protein [Cytobacillus sp. FSL K6-0129]|uniref:endonuclease domain-containing protein n=1 Tax=Cytobacillus sp. FSL K6-0129 TaxID=2921421 RepID=UPI0030F9112F
MIEYIVFFGLLAIGLLAFIFFKPPAPVLNEIQQERIKCESHIEGRLFEALIDHGFIVNTQVKCGRYRIDLTLPNYKIAIECDGKAYHSSPAQKAHDRKKDKFLRNNGWVVLRFSGRQINRELSKVIKRIDEVTSREIY